MFVQAGSIEIHPARAFELSFSTQLARQVAFTGARRQEFSFGATATVMPTSQTTIYAGIDRGFELKRSGACNVVSAGIDTKIPGTPVSLNADCWTVLGPLSDAKNSDPPCSGVSGAIALQINDRLWTSLGIEWDTANDFAAHCTDWRYYFSIALQTSVNVTFALDISYTIFSSEGLAAASREELSEARIRLSRRTQLAENFATEISLEWATGTLVAENESDRPALRLAGKFDF